MSSLTYSDSAIKRELDWLYDLVKFRISKIDRDIYVSKKYESLWDITPPAPDDSAFGEFISGRDLSIEDRVLLVLPLAAHLAPGLLTSLTWNMRIGKPYTDAGGVTGHYYRGFIPTGSTYLFVMAGDDLRYRMQLLDKLDEDHPLLAEEIISFAPSYPAEPVLSAPIILNPEYLRLFISSPDKISKHLQSTATHENL